MLPRGPSNRPLPNPPSILAGKEYHDHAYSSPFQLDYSRNPYLPSNYVPSTAPGHNEYELKNALPGGTLLHKGFYDLLSMIPTPSPSRLLWGPAGSPTSGEHSLVAGPRYEALPTSTIPPSKYTSGQPSSPTSPTPKRGKRISKDMIAKPTGFM
jgi:protein-serine/threonine kinase